jgi:hypothetical protein
VTDVGGRDPVKTFAAYDDPLRDERAQHGEVLGRRPAFEPRQLVVARTKASRAAAEVTERRRRC